MLRLRSSGVLDFALWLFFFVIDVVLFGFVFTLLSSSLICCFDADNASIQNVMNTTKIYVNPDIHEAVDFKNRSESDFSAIVGF